MRPNFKNTSRLSGTALDEAELKARSQKEVVLLFFKRHPHRWTPSQVHEALGGWDYCVINSIRRSMTDLSSDEDGDTSNGWLVKTDETTDSPYGGTEHYWRPNPRHIRMNAEGKQGALFQPGQSSGV